MKKFKTAAMDSGVKSTTILLATVLSFLGIYFLTMAAREGSKTYFVSGLLPILIIVIAYLVRPKSYEIDHGRLAIRQGIKSTFLKIRDVNSIEDLVQVKSTFGTGSFFGYIGRPQKDEFWCATNKNRLLKLKTRDLSYFISPDDMENFKKEIKKFQI